MHPGDGRCKRQVEVSESLFDPLNLTHNAFALSPIVFCNLVRAFARADWSEMQYAVRI
jgi:hypothetical protein